MGSFLWEVFPEDAGTIINAQSPDAQFEAQREVGAVLRLTASDGLFQVISQCTTQIEGFLGVAVALEADPIAALVGETVTLSCSNDGTLEPVIVAISQESGVIVALTEQSPGVWTFVPTDIGDLTFRCVGETDLGVQSEAVTVTVSVTQTLPPDDGGSENGNDNTNTNANENANENGNVNENGSDNTNTNGGRIPPR